jgi:hypothetical protein
MNLVKRIKCEGKETHGSGETRTKKKGRAGKTKNEMEGAVYIVTVWNMVEHIMCSNFDEQSPS